MVSHPFHKLFSLYLACRYRQNDSLFLVCLSGQFVSVRVDENAHSSISRAFVTIEKRMVTHESEAEASRFFGQCRIEFLPAECHLRLNRRRFQTALVTNPVAATMFENGALMERHHLLDGAPSPVGE
jgi:hypothetical protein